MKFYQSMDPAERDAMIRTSVAGSSRIEGYHGGAADKLLKGQLKESVEAYRQSVNQSAKAVAE